MRTTQGLLGACVCALAWGGGPAWAQQVALAPALWAALPEAPPLAVAQGTWRAYPPLQVGRAGVAQAEAEAMVALAAFDPQWRGKAETTPSGQYPNSELDLALVQVLPQSGLRWEGGYRLGQGRFATYDAGETNAGGELRVGLSLPLLRFRDWDRRRADLAKAALLLGAARAEADALALGAYQDLARRHWAWVAARGVQGVALGLAQRAQARARDVAVAVRAGSLAPIEAMEAQRGAISRQAEAIAAQRQVEATALAYAIFRRQADGAYELPRPEGPASMPQAPSPEACGADDLAGAIARAPQRRRLAAITQGAALERELAAQLVLPALDLGAVASQDLGPGLASRATPDLKLSLGLEWPLVPRGPEARKQVAEALLQRSQAQERLVGDQVALGLADSRSALQAWRERLKLLQADADLAARLATLESERLRLGEGTAFTVNLREQVAFEAARRAWEAHAEALAAAAACRVASTQIQLLEALALPVATSTQPLP